MQEEAIGYPVANGAPVSLDQRYHFTLDGAIQVRLGKQAQSGQDALEPLSAAALEGNDAVGERGCRGSKTISTRRNGDLADLQAGTAHLSSA